MLTFWGVVTALTVYGGIPTVGGLWMFESRRARRRNQRGECAACGNAWSATSSVEPYLIHGRLVCEACAAKARRRMPWHFGIIGVSAALATGLSIAGAEVALMILLPAASTLVLTVGTVQVMKLANRVAQRRIAAGEYPAMKLLLPRASAGDQRSPGIR
jgi:hypothetical protein